MGSWAYVHGRRHQTAVIQGLDPGGSRLEAPMPQWQLTDSEWTDLLAYLKTLD